MNQLHNDIVSIIMPAYNEERYIRSSLEETIKTFEDFNTAYEIVVVDDGSTDRTYQVALSVADQYADGRVIVKRNRQNFGKGRALKKGFRYTKGDYIVFLDADMDLHPRQIETFFDLMVLTESDVVIGSKMHPNSKLEYPWHRRLLSRGYYALVKLLFGLPVRDTQTGLKLFRRSVLRDVLHKILIKKFAFDLEILANAYRDGFSITEAPIILTSRRVTGRIGLRAVFRTMLDTLAIFYRMRIIKFYDRVPFRKRRPELRRAAPTMTLGIRNRLKTSLHSTASTIR